MRVPYGKVYKIVCRRKKIWTSGYVPWGLFALGPGTRQWRRHFKEEKRLRRERKATSSSLPWEEAGTVSTASVKETQKQQRINLPGGQSRGTAAHVGNNTIVNKQ